MEVATLNGGTMPNLGTFVQTPGQLRTNAKGRENSERLNSFPNAKVFPALPT